MKPPLFPPSRRKSQSASVLVTALILGGVLTLTLVAYLSLTAHQNLNNVRSMAWNSTMPILEAGVEEALVHLNSTALNSTNWGTEGWTLTNNVYYKKRTMNEGYYEVVISNVMPPVIYADGYAHAPYQQSYIQRNVRVETKRDALFTKSMVAKGQIDLQGNNVTTDSFDSTDPNYSTGGAYDPSKRKANGDVATNSELINSLNAGNANIYGKVSTGPGGTISIGPNGAVGDQAWHSGGNTGIQPGWSSDDMNVAFPEVEAPFAYAVMPSGGTVDGVYYKYVLSSGDYQLSAISLSGQDKVLVTGDARLLVDGDFSMSGKSQIIIDDYARLEMYVGGPNGSIGGNGVMNKPGNASNFAYYGLPSHTNLSFSGNADFTGFIYAPEADFTLGGGGSSTYDFVGASITGSVQMNGHFNFHYDESLAKYGPRRGYVVSNWEEI